MKTESQSSPLRRWAVKSLVESGWAPLCVFGLHVLMSKVFNAYAAFPGIDIPMHFMGGIVIAFFFHRASINGSHFKLLGPFHPTTHVLLVFFATCSTAVFWEFAEFINDRYFGGHAQAGLIDTLRDMSMGITGGTAFLLALMPRISRLVTKHAELGAR
jgi:hypothetical protein